jgi:Domain of unknown function (DUF4838)
MIRERSKLSLTLLICLLCALGCISMNSSEAAGADGKLVLVENGVSRAPIIVFEGAPIYIRRAANELAEYIEKTSGARPEVIKGEPKPIPKHAIWVGFQPKLKELFPKVDFDFKHHEEILIVATENHLVIAGRDRWDPKHMEARNRKNKLINNGKQQEYGTVNAVYTFLQDNLGVRWLWPGELGEDVLSKKTIAFAPFQYRYHPQIRSRGGAFVYSSFPYLPPGGGYGLAHDWLRFQRLQLDSLELPGGHPFKYWSGRFLKTHPEYFALQPDGTRGTFPTNPKYVKLCESNPGVRKQWLADVEEQLKKYPNRRVFGCAPNDGWGSGECVCKNCSAWDHPDGEMRTFRWSGLVKKHVAESDRQVTFANHCARLLKKRYPDKDYYVVMMAYGHSRPGAIKAVPDDNVIVSSVANFLCRSNLKDRGSPQGTTHRQQFADWGKIAPHLMWRPNIGNPAGWKLGQPDISIEQTIKDFKFVADNNCVGLFFDTVWEHWATQGPQYYIMAQLAWNPYVDGQAVMADYYSRAFGPAVDEMTAYWDHIGDARTDYVESDNTYPEVFNKAFFAKAYGFLDQASKTLEGKPEIYRKRVAFVRVGLDYTKLIMNIRVLMRRYDESKKKDLEAAKQARAAWGKIEELRKANPNKRNSPDLPINWVPAGPGSPRMKGLHPDFPGRQKGLRKKKKISQMPKSSKAVKLVSAEKAGWQLAFRDDFKRKELGDDWRALEGDWLIKDGVLQGSGTLISTRGFPDGDAVGFQRMEFDVTAYVNQSLAADKTSKSSNAGSVSDMSSLIHVPAATKISQLIQGGYFFQFGGRWNKKTQLHRAGDIVQQNLQPKAMIIPGKTHKIVVENDNGRVRFFVDGRLTLEHTEKESIVSSKQKHVGLYFYTVGKVNSVKVYVKPLTDGLDLD